MKRQWIVCPNCLVPNPGTDERCRQCSAALLTGMGGSVAFNPTARDVIRNMGGVSAILPMGADAVIVWCEAGAFLYSAGSIRWQRFLGFVDDIVIGEDGIHISSGGFEETIPLEGG